MNYSAAGIANVALQRIGARGTITSLTENNPNAVKVNIAWNYVFPEVLSERDWKFAKTRVQLQQSTTQPTYAYQYAYGLPADFLRLAKPREIPEERRIASADWYGGGYGGDGWGDGGYNRRDIPVFPHHVAPYVVETISPDGINYTTCLLTNYSACVIPVSITYIRLITDLTQLLPGFVNALTFRLAGELAIAITEDKAKAQDMMAKYLLALSGAQAQQECDDSLKDEAGSQSWVQAGRYGGWYR